MEVCCEASDYDDYFKVIDIDNIPPPWNDESIGDDREILNMTSLRSLLLGQTRSQSPGSSDNDDGADDDTNLRRLSLAYEGIERMPQILIEELAPTLQILDISNNEFSNIDFLSDFKVLTSLICDRNNVNSNTSIPFLPKLELLWMNHCKLTELYPWARKLQQSCPNLKYLSLMGNPIAPSYLNGGNFYEYLQYRFFIISLFPNLIHLDDRIVTAEQRTDAQKMYHRPILDRIVSNTQKNLPYYLRVVSGKLSDLFTPTPSFAKPKRNGIV